MNLHRLLQKRAAEDRPVRAGVIGAGPQVAALLAQAPRIPGFHVMAVADADPQRARATLAAAGWSEERYAAGSPAKAVAGGTTFVTDDTEGIIYAGGLEVLIEASNDAAAGVRHALAAFRRGRHVVMANPQADALAGPLLARRARQGRCVYTLAAGAPSGRVCRHLDWAATLGLSVVGAGFGVRHAPGSCRIHPGTVWEARGLTEEAAASRALDARQAVAGADGSLAAFELAAVANAGGLDVAAEGPRFAPCRPGELARVLIPRSHGGILDGPGMAEVLSSVDAQGRPLADSLEGGSFLTVEATSEAATRAFLDAGLGLGGDGRYAAVWHPPGPGGAELVLSAASAVLRGETIGAPQDFRADVVATAKKGLDAGQVLDGEGGYCLYGRTVPAAEALEQGYLPLGLAAAARLKTHIAVDHPVRWFDVEIDEGGEAADILAFRREMEQRFAGRTANTGPAPVVRRA